MAGMIPRSFVNDLLTRTDIIDLIDARVPLRKNGTNFVACCPFHSEKSPSFSVNPKQQFFYCFGCGKGGNAITFLIDFERLSFPEAVEQLANMQGLSIPYENGTKPQQYSKDDHQTLYQLLKDAARYYANQLKKHPKATEYLHQRGLDDKVISRYQVGFAPNGWDNLLKHCHQHENALAKAGMITKKDNGHYYDRFRDRIMFPIRDRQGRMIGFGGRALDDSTPKYLNSPETPIFHKGRELFGLYEAQQANRSFEYIVVVEGYMDVIALAQYGITQCVATLGTATSQQHLQKLYRCCDTIVFCYDGDPAGRKAGWRAMEALLPILEDGRQAKFMFLPEKEDPDSLVRKVGEQGFRQQILDATPLSEFLFLELKSQCNDVQSMDGRSQLAKLALSLISKLPKGIFQQMLLDKLSGITRLSPQILQNLSENKQPNPEPSEKPTVITKTRLSPSQLAIALLLQNPELANKMDNTDFLAQINEPYCKIFHQLIDRIQDHDAINAGNLLESWRGSDWAPVLAELAAWDTLIPKKGMIDEFNGILSKLRGQNIESEIRTLLNKANMEPLTEEEKKQLQWLISTKKKKS